MNECLKIVGKKPLNGEVNVSSSKNAACAILPAVVMASEVVKLYDVPNIQDTNALVELLSDLNIKVDIDKDTYTIDPTNIQNIALSNPACNRLRASYYFMGALLGRFKHCRMLLPGGCNLGPRPIDLHLKGFEALGAKVKCEDGYIDISAEELIGDHIYLDFASVGATVNIMLAAIFAKGRTTIENAAKEPEIIDLSNMLNNMGASIRGAGTSEINIDGVSRLKGCIHDIIPDRIEAGTFIIMAAALNGHVKVNNVIPQHIESMLLKLDEIGVKMEIGSDYVEIFEHGPLNACDIKTMPYPGFATDLQQPLTALLTASNGASHIKETIYIERFKHCAELNKMGANITYKEGESKINGPTELKGCEVTATDLRCGAALIIAGLMAEGETIIHDAYHIYRGYSDIVEKLKKLGACIEWIIDQIKYTMKKMIG